MSPGLRQAGLALIFLGTIGLVGSAPRPAPDGLEAAIPAPPSAQAGAAPAEKASDTSSATTTTTSAPARPRQLDVDVYPSDASARVTVTDATGATSTGVDGFDGTVAGQVTVRISAPGYRSETHTLPPDRTGPFEVFLDPPDQAVDRLTAFLTGAAPKQVAFTPDGSELWVTLLAGSGVEVYDPATGDLLSAIDLPEAGSVEVIFDAAGERAWVSQMETARVYELDVASRRVLRHLDTGGSWTKVMALAPDETRLWASNWVSNDVTEFDLGTGEALRRMSTVATPRGLVTDGGRLYVAGYDTGALQMIDLQTGTAEVLHTTGGALRHLVRDPVGGRIYASDMALDRILVIDPDTNEVEELATTDRLPNTIDLSPDGRLLAVSNRGTNNPDTYYLPGPEWGSVQLFDTATGEMLDALVGGNQPTGLDVSSDGSLLAYSDFLDNRVTVVSLPSVDALREAGGGRSATYRSELRK